jgi:hypothetical protein
MDKRYRGHGLLDSIKEFGGKVLNRTIDILPIELHLPGYSFCGPGTRLSERLAKGEKGINKLDSACRKHDLAYSKHKDSKSRAAADRELAEQAWARASASDASLGEKAAAVVVTNLMKLKNKFGGGTVRKRRRRRRRRRTNRLVGQGLYLRNMKGRGLQIKKKKTSSRCQRTR